MKPARTLSQVVRRGRFAVVLAAAACALFAVAVATAGPPAGAQSNPCTEAVIGQLAARAAQGWRLTDVGRDIVEKHVLPGQPGSKFQDGGGTVITEIAPPGTTRGRTVISPFNIPSDPGGGTVYAPVLCGFDEEGVATFDVAPGSIYGTWHAVDFAGNVILHPTPPGVCPANNICGGQTYWNAPSTQRLTAVTIVSTSWFQITGLFCFYAPGGQP
jgi:hypothetical protein